MTRVYNLKMLSTCIQKNKCDICENISKKYYYMFDLVPPIYNHYPCFNKTDELFLCSICFNRLDNVRTNFLSNNPEWHKYTPEKQEIQTANIHKEQKEQMYNNAIKDIMHEYEQQCRFGHNTYELFSSGPNIIDTECLKSPTRPNGSSNSCKSPIPTAKLEHKNEKFV